jgi:hypothetical protein
MNKMPLESRNRTGNGNGNDKSDDDEDGKEERDVNDKTSRRIASEEIHQFVHRTVNETGLPSSSSHPSLQSNEVSL